MAASHGESIGAYAAVILDHPLPWTKMRQVYALLGLVKKWGPAPVEEACRQAADAEAFSVHLIGRMLVRGSVKDSVPAPSQGSFSTGRFVRPAEDFRVHRANSADPDGGGVALRPAEATTEGDLR